MRISQLSSSRLILRPLAISDLAQIHHLHSLPQTDQFNALGIPENIEVTREIIENWLEKWQETPISNCTFVIEKKEAHEFIGLFGLKIGAAKYKRAEIWYKLLPDCWGQGYATESVKRILDFAFGELGLHRVEAGCAVENHASIRVLEKVGMSREGRKRKVLPLKTGWSDNFEYAILEEDWKNETTPYL